MRCVCSCFHVSMCTVPAMADKANLFQADTSATSVSKIPVNAAAVHSSHDQVFICNCDDDNDDRRPIDWE